MRNLTGFVSDKLTYMIVLLVCILLQINHAGAADVSIDAQSPHITSAVSANQILELSSTSLHYQREDGGWEQISTQLMPDSRTEGFGYAARQNRFAVEVADGPVARVRMNMEGYYIDYTAVAPPRTMSSVAASRVMDEQVTYDHIWPDVSIEYKVYPDYLKQEIILHQPGVSNSFRFLVDVQGLQPRLETNGEISLLDPSGEEIFVVLAPFAYDSARKPEFGAAEFVLLREDGEYYLDIVVDKAWLEHPARVYPVVIDPTTTLPVKNSETRYFNIGWAQTFTYDYRVCGHTALLKKSSGRFRIWDPQGNLKVNREQTGSGCKSDSNIGVPVTNPAQFGTWKVTADGTNQYSSGSGTIRYQDLFQSGLRGEVSGSNAITWTWDDPNIEEDGYRLYDEAGQLVADLPRNTTRYVETGLVEAAPYTRTVVAYKGTYEGPASEPFLQYAQPLQRWYIDNTSEWATRGVRDSTIVLEDGAIRLGQYEHVDARVFTDDFEDSYVPQGYDSIGWYQSTNYANSGEYSVAGANSGTLSRTFSGATRIVFYGLYEGDPSETQTFRINGVSQPCVGGEQIWVRCEYNLPRDTYTFRWEHWGPTYYDEEEDFEYGPWGQYYIDSLRVDYGESVIKTHTSGTWEMTIDAGTTTQWLRKNIDFSAPPGSSVTVEFASSNNGVTYSTWRHSLKEDGGNAVPDGRYLKVRIRLTSNGTLSAVPVVRSFELIGSVGTLGPIVKMDSTSPPSPTPNRLTKWNWFQASHTGGSGIKEYRIRVFDASGNLIEDNILPSEGALALSHQTDPLHYRNSGVFRAQVRAITTTGVTGPWSAAARLEILPDAVPPLPPASEPYTAVNPTYASQPVWHWPLSGDPSGVLEYHVALGRYDDEEPVWFYFDEVYLSPGDLSSGQVAWQTSTILEPGTYALKVAASDLAGNLGDYGPIGRVYVEEPDISNDIVNVLSASSGPKAQYDLHDKSPLNSYFHAMNETVNPLNGALAYRMTDLRLPGKGGFDLTLERVYTSASAGAYRMRATYNPYIGAPEGYAHPSTHLDSLWGLGVGWGFNFPSIELVQEENVSRRYLHLGNGTVLRINADNSGLEGYPLKDLMYKATDSTNKYTSKNPWNSGQFVSANRVLVQKDQQKYYFGDVAGKPRLLAIESRHGSLIHFEWAGSEHKLSNIIDSVGRQVVFSYTNSAVTATYDTYTITYLLQDAGSGIPKKRLDKVVHPVGAGQPAQETRYDYEIGPAHFFFGSSDYGGWNQYLNLTKVTMPSGAWVRIEYQKATKNLARTGHMEYFRVSSRDEVFFENGTEKRFNRSTFTYSPDNHSGYPQYTDPTDAPENWRFWTEVLDVETGMAERTTYDKRHLVVEKLRKVESEGQLQYKEVETIDYSDLDHKLPTKRTITLYDAENQPGEPRIYLYGYDASGYGDVVASIGPLGQVSTFQYDPTLRVPVATMTRQSGDADQFSGQYLVTENTLNSNGDVTTQSHYRREINADGGEADPITATSPAISGTGKTWRWVTSSPTNQISATVYWEANPMWQNLSYEVAYRKLGETTWTRFGSGGGRGGFSTKVVGTDTHDRSVVLGIYEIQLKITASKGSSSARISNLTIQAPRNSVEGPVETTFDRDSWGNILVQRVLVGDDSNQTHRFSYDATHIAADGPTGQPWTAVSGTKSGEDYQGVYLTRQWTVVTDADGGSQTLSQWFEYDNYGRQLATYDGDKTQTTYVYDKVGRVTKETYPAVNGVTHSQQILYDDQNSRVTMIDELGHQTELQFDPWMRLLTTKRLVGGVWNTLNTSTYDTKGNKITEQNANGVRSQYTYDFLGRITSVTSAVGTSVQAGESISYDDVNRQQKTRDDLGNKTIVTFDALGREVEIRQHPTVGADPTASGAYVTVFEYDVAGNRTKVVNPNGNAIEFQYGLLNRLTKEEHPAGLADVSYFYDAAGNVRLVTQGGTSVEYDYDEANRLRTRAYSIEIGEATQAVAKYYYDEASNVTRIKTEAGAETTEVEFIRDPRQRLTEERVTINNGQAHSIRYPEYDGAGNLLAMAYPGDPIDNPLVRYEYDEYNRVKNAVGFTGTYGSQGLRYDAAGNLTGMDYLLQDGSKLTSSIVPDARNRIDTLNVVRQTDQVTLLGLDYTYDGTHNVTSIHVNNGTSWTESFQYDGLNRLTSFTQQGTTTTYAFDAAGNRTHLNGTQSWRYNAANQISDIRIGSTWKPTTYDPRGNLTVKPLDAGTDKETYVYDGENRLLRVQRNGATVLENVYDGLGRRVKSIENGLETFYLYVGNDVAWEQTGTADIKYVFVGGKRLARVATDAQDITRHYYHSDHLGSTRLLTRYADGGVEARMNHQPYGEAYQASGDVGTYKFTGKGDHSVTQLYYYGARFYDPTLGRFITLDPARDGMNWYAYANNNPLKYVDPDGQFAQLAVLLIIIALIPGDNPVAEPVDPAAFSMAVDFLPVIGDIKGVAEFWTGYDLLKPEERFGWGDRVLGLFFLSELRAVGGLSSLAKGTSNLVQGATRLHKHHILPREFAPYFARRGIDIDQFTIVLDQTTHLRGVHGRGLGELPGRWNPKWKEWIDANPDATAEEVFDFARSLLEDFGLKDLPIVPYK